MKDRRIYDRDATIKIIIALIGAAIGVASRLCSGRH